MNTYVTGEAVGSGLYMSWKQRDLRIVTETEQVLDGEPEAIYRRIPLWMLVALAPVLGGLYAMAFPVIIFSALLKVVAENVGAFRVHTAGEEAPWGVYVALNHMAVAHVTATGERLGGEVGTRFLRVPTWLLVVGSPLVGGAYVLFFPVILAVALVAAVGGALLRALRNPGEKHEET